MAKVDFAPDGEHWQKVKIGTTANVWNFFVMDNELRKSLILMPGSKSRMIGETGKTIGVMMWNKDRGEMVHLKEND